MLYKQQFSKYFYETIELTSFYWFSFWSTIDITLLSNCHSQFFTSTIAKYFLLLQNYCYIFFLKPRYIFNFFILYFFIRAQYRKKSRLCQSNLSINCSFVIEVTYDSKIWNTARILVLQGNPTLFFFLFSFFFLIFMLNNARYEWSPLCWASLDH